MKTKISIRLDTDLLNRAKKRDQTLTSLIEQSLHKELSNEYINKSDLDAIIEKFEKRFKK